MAEVTKACSLTEDEILVLMASHGIRIGNPMYMQDYTIERINYLNKRLKAFKEPEETKTETATAPGWGLPT